MTLLAGIVALDGTILPDALCHELKRALSRRSEERVFVHRELHACLVKLDHGSFGAAAQQLDGDAVTLLTGEPLITRNASRPGYSRAADAALLHEQLLRGDRSALREARGVFSLAHYVPRTGVLILATDKLGIRPLYCWTDGRHVAFASALRILEALSVVDKRMDVRSVTEITAFGYPLGARTPYVGVELLEAGEIRQFGSARTETGRYWRWDEIEESRRDTSALSTQLFDTFREAVRIRLRADRGAVGFLSGGLDSRCVVAALRAEGAAVHTFNFALAGTQDRVFGERLAQAAGTVHHECEVDDPVDTRWSSIMADAIERSGLTTGAVERSRCAWSGDGGSVGLGHVYLGRRVVTKLRADDLDGATSEYLEHERAFVVRRLLRPRIAGELASLPHRSVRAELDRIRSEDPVQRFYLFLMLNDQHRHLARHFEDIDRHRLELQLPFLDSDFLAVIASIPAELRLYHRFYVEWLEHFPAYVRSIPWQAYPGHVACPLPIHDAGRLAYQWDDSVTAAKRAMRRRAVVAEAGKILASGGFASPLMRRAYLALASLAHVLGVRDYHYVLDAARTYQHYWRACGGSHELRPGRS